MTMSFDSLSLNSLTPDLVHLIAFHVGTTPLLGPPSGLVPLLSVSRRINSIINQEANPHLYAQIFRAKFDIAAIRRRFPANSVTAHALSDELARRWRSLRRIRKWAGVNNASMWTSVQYYRTREMREDLMTAYIMLVESDGYNALQLLRWANIEDYLVRFKEYRLVPEHEDPVMPRESEEKSLFLWISWLLLDYPNLLTSRYGQADNWVWLMTPYTIGTFAYKGFYAPWTLHHSPPSTTQSSTALPELTVESPLNIADNSLTPRPLCSSLRNYLGFPLRISPPILSQAATLLHVVRYSQRPSYNPNLPYPSDEQLLETAVRSGGPASASTLHSDQDIHRVSNTKTPYAPDHLQVVLNSVLDSTRHDDDWYRHVSCRDPYLSHIERSAPSIRSYRFRPGSISGQWDGRFMIIDLFSHQRIMNGMTAPINVIEELSPVQHLQAWNIQEHHYRGPRRLQHSNEIPTYYSCTGYTGKKNEPKKRILGEALVAGDPMNGFLPPGFIRDSTRSKVWDGRKWHSGIDVRGNGGRDEEAAFYKTWTPEDADDFDEPTDPDLADHTISTIITGEAIMMAPAYSSIMRTQMPLGSTMVGTVRKWDGLVTLRVQPSTNSTDGAHIYRGYLVGGNRGDGNWVGRWRDGGDGDVRVVGYEGSFVMSKRK